MRRSREAGHQAVLDGVFARIPQYFEGFTIDVARIVSLGDTVLVEARYRATVRATGKPLDAQVAHVWDFHDGKILHWQQYTGDAAPRIGIPAAP